MASFEFQFGSSRWAVDLASQAIEWIMPSTDAPVHDVRAAVLHALEHPSGVESLRRALTPDDRITVVVDESLPRSVDVISAVLEYLATSGIEPAMVTVVGPEGTRQSWIDHLEDRFASVTAEVHRPDDRDRLSYLAGFADGRRIYVNRSVVDADQTIVLTAGGYSSLTGLRDGPSLLYPMLADREAQSALVSRINPNLPLTADRPTRAETDEVAWLLGMPFYVHIEPGVGDSILRIDAGLPTGLSAARARYDSDWRTGALPLADIVVTELRGPADGHGWANMARSAAVCATACKPGGSVVILTESVDDPGPGLSLMRRHDDPVEAAREVHRSKPSDAEAALDWAWSAGRCRIHLASEIRPTIIEEMFAEPIGSPRDLERILDEGESIRLIPDAFRRAIGSAP